MLQNLVNGLRVALFIPLRHSPFRYSWEAFWSISLLGVAASCVLSFYQASPPMLFQPYAILSESFALIAVLLAAFLVSRLFGDARLQVRLPVIFLNATLWVAIFSTVLMEAALADILVHSPLVAAITQNLVVLWYVLISIRAVALVTEARPLYRLGSALLLSGILLTPALLLQLPRFWETDYYSLYQAEAARAVKERGPELNAEQVLTGQWPILQKAWSTLRAGEAGQTDLYFVGFAGHGEQDVFRKEIEFSRQLFDQQFGTQSHSLALINHPRSVAQAPLANATNLQASLEYMNGLIQPEEDLLFLFLTSHGSQEHALSVTLPPLPMDNLSASRLAELLQTSHFKWKVIVISACYSGGFIEHLKSPHHLIITAARPDRTSFGCSDDAELTYFGRAYFSEALPQTADFIEAFVLAKSLVAQWEEADGFTPSEPQIFIGSEIQEKLRSEGIPKLRMQAASRVQEEAAGSVQPISRRH